LASEAESQEPEAVRRSPWLGDVLYPGIALIAAVVVALVPWLIRPSAEQPGGLVTAYVLVGPLLAVGLLIIAAFRLRNLRGDADSRYGGAAGATVALAGLACLIVAVVVPTMAPERASSWTIGVVLEAAGVLTIGAAMVIASRRRVSPRKPVPDDPRLVKYGDPLAHVLEWEVTQSADRWRRSSRWWGTANYVLGFLTATLSGAAGISGVSGDPSTTDTVFGILAIVGGGLAALSTSLGAAEGHRRSKMKAEELEALARQIRWRPSGPGEEMFDAYVDRFNEVTGPDWPLARAGSAGDSPG
jgi:hypothetical protein